MNEIENLDQICEAVFFNKKKKQKTNKDLIKERNNLLNELTSASSDYYTTFLRLTKEILKYYPEEKHKEIKERLIDDALRRITFLLTGKVKEKDTN